MNEWMNYGGDCRTAPATPGLLKNCHRPSEPVPSCHWHQWLSHTSRNCKKAIKLDGVGPSPTSSTALSKIRREKIKEEKVTCDTWHVSRDTWHVTRDMWQMVGVNILSKCKLPSSYVWDRQCLEDSELKDDLMNERMNELINQLITKVFIEQSWLHRVCY